MHRFLLALLTVLLTGSIPLRADGGFSAKNSFGVADRRYILDADGVTPLSKSFGRFEILSGGARISAVADGTGSTFYADGLFALGIVTIPGTTAGSSATVVVRAWDNRFGATYADAVASGAHFGEFQCLVTGLGEGISPPSPDAFLAFQSFALNTANLLPLGSLATSVTGQGAVTVAPAKALYHPAEPVTLTATPAAGWSFAGWSGSVVSGASPLTITVPSSMSVVANFKPLRQLTLTQAGAGTVLATPAGPYADGTVVSVTATPAAGWSFVGWQGDATGSANPLSITLVADASIQAVFQQQFSIQTLTAGQGQVQLSPAGPLFNAGTPVQATALAAAGWRFVGWSGAASGTASPVTVVADANKILTATFQPEWPLTLSTTGSGTVAATPSPGPYLDGTPVVLTAIPTGDAVFTGWSGSVSSTANPLTVTMSSALQITASFSPTFPVTVTATGSGTVALQPQKARYTLNEPVSAVATPAAGWSFAGWSGDLTSSSSTLGFKVTQATALVATFKPNRQLTLTQSGQGTVVATPGGPYVDGTTVSIQATAASGWSFVGWQGGASGTANPLSVTLNADTAIQAVFQQLWPLTTHVSGPGSIALVPQAAAYLDGSLVQLIATPSANAVFAGWTGSTNSSSATLSLAVTSAVDLTANFLPTFALTTTVTGQGTVTVVPQKARYVTNDLVTLTATPANGWDFTSWSGAAAGSAPSVQVRMTGDLAVAALFTAQPPPIQVAGTAVDGYIAGAKVFFDANRNGILDAGEPFTTTDRAGKFNLVVDVKKFDLNHDGKLSPEEGRIVVDGGVDLSTGETRTGQLTAPVTASVVTPITTLVDAVSGANPGMGVDESERRVKAALGVPAEIAVNAYDPIQAAAGGDTRAVAVQAANATISDTVSQLSVVLDKGSAADSRQANDAVNAALATQASAGQPLNLNQGSGVASLLDAASKSVGASLSTAAASVVSDVVAAQNAAKSAVSGASGDLVGALQQIGKVQAVSQGAAQTALGALASGDAGADEVRLSFTGVALTAAVNAAPVGDLFATNRAVGTFSLLQTAALATEDGRVVQPLTVVRRDGASGAVRVSVTFDTAATLTTNRVFIDFADGELLQNVDLRSLLVDNTTPDPERHLSFTLALAAGAPAAAKLAAPQTGVLTVVDNDAAGTVSFGGSNFSVSEDGTPLIPVVLERSGGSAGTVVVEVTAGATADGGAVAGVDFVAGKTTVTFGPGELRRTIPLPVIDDTVAEPTKKFALTLKLGAGSASGSSVNAAASAATVSIIDNDGAPVLEIARNGVGGPKFTVRGPVRGRYLLQASSDLKTWSAIGAPIQTEGADTAVLLGVPSSVTAGQFVRAVSAP
jgi:uncharacterized repeat protein (TIGR02543 family)